MATPLPNNFERRFPCSHNSPWEYKKTHIVDFATKARDSILNYEPRSIKVEGHTITTVESYKFLGVYLDHHLNFKKQAAYTVEKGAKYVVQIWRIARTTKGVEGSLIRPLYIAIPIPKLTYAVDVWFTPIRDGIQGRCGGLRGFMKQIASVQCAAAILVTGAMRSSPGDLLDLHADLWPVPLLLDKVCYRSVLRLSTLDNTHTLHQHIRNAHQHHSIRNHPSPLHLLYDAYCSLNPRDIKDIPTYHHNTKWSPLLKFNIPDTKTAAIAQDSTAFRSYRYSVYTDGSAQDGRVGAAAVLSVERCLTKELYYHLGSERDYGNYEAEAVGLLLSAHLLDIVRSGDARIASDSQAIVKVTHSSRPKPSHHLLAAMHPCLETQKMAIAARGRTCALTLDWVLGHCGMEGNVAADRTAKAAAQGQHSWAHKLPPALNGLDMDYMLERLPASTSACQRTYTDSLKRRWVG